MKSENKFVIISDRLAALNSAGNVATVHKYVAFDTGDFFAAKDIRYRDSEHNTSTLENYTKLSTISRYVSRPGVMNGGAVAQFAAEKGFSRTDRAEKRSNQRKQRQRDWWKMHPLCIPLSLQ